jgi:spore coat polysaccharide biosynthesis protein SpsF
MEVEDMRTVAIIQARMGSTRLPGKILRPLAGRPVLGWVLRAARQAERVDDIVVATTVEAADDATEAFCRDEGVAVHRGSVEDVLTRFLGALDQAAPTADAVLRLTADCPLLDPRLLDAGIGAFGAGDLEYLSTGQPRSLPRGLDVEVVSVAALRAADPRAEGVERVHVTPYLYLRPAEHRVGGLVFQPDNSDLRVTLDTPEDATLLEALAAELGDRVIPWREVVALLRNRPDLVALNAEVRQKELAEG